MRDPLNIYEYMHAERQRAHQKHKDKPGGSMEMKDFDSPDWLPVVVEEVGEVARAMADHRHGLLTDEQFRAQMESELIQCGAMFAAWLAALRYRDQNATQRLARGPWHGMEEPRAALTTPEIATGRTEADSENPTCPSCGSTNYRPGALGCGPSGCINVAG